MAGKDKPADEETPVKTKQAGPATPSGLALAEVGEPKEGATDEELVAHSDKYLAAKLKARRG